MALCITCGLLAEQGLSSPIGIDTGSVLKRSLFMEIRTYALEDMVEADHWWFVGRRRLFSDIITSMDLPAGAAILDIGTSTGTNLRMLSNLGFRSMYGIDSSPEALRFCVKKGIGDVLGGDATALPFADHSFDLVLATDIIEHVDDDIGALREIHRVLKPGSRLLLTVPTFELLWGLQDKIGHHKRRYRLRELQEKMFKAEFSIIKSFYFNYILFVPILCGRRLIQIIGVKVENESQINTYWINRILSTVFLFDIRTAPRIRPPFGVSALAVGARR